MRECLRLFLALVFAFTLFPDWANAAQQRVAIRLGGKYCLFHTIDIGKALKDVHGVIDVDFESMRGNVIVVMKAGQVNPDHLLAAVRQIKGDGYYCTGRLSEPGRVEY